MGKKYYLRKRKQILFLYLAVHAFAFLYFISQFGWAMNLDDDYQNSEIFIALLIVDDEGLDGEALKVATLFISGNEVGRSSL